MTEYGEKLVEAASDAIRSAFLHKANADYYGRAALLDFIDKLIEEGPSEGMLRGAALKDQFLQREFSARLDGALRALRTEIPEER